MNPIVPLVLAATLAAGAPPGASKAPAATSSAAFRSGDFALSPGDPAGGLIDLRIEGWPGFLLSGLRPAVKIDGAGAPFSGCRLSQSGRELRARFDFSGKASLDLVFTQVSGGGLRLTSRLRNKTRRGVVLNEIDLLAAGADVPGRGATFGLSPASVRVFEQGYYWGRTVPLVAARAPQNAGGAAEPAGVPESGRHGSDFVSVVFDRAGKRAFLAGFESSERWWGKIEIDASKPGPAGWRIGFDGGDLAVGPGESVEFEPVVLMTGNDPWHLLEIYADDAARLHPSPPLPSPPVSWCSWYPYRLGVTEGRLLDEARLAAERLQPLGLSVMEIDLGWESGQLPSTFDENDHFPRGLKWLSGELGKLGFRLGVWCAPFSISEFDPVAAAHPEWLVKGGGGAPFNEGDWFWPPHGKVYILDLTHPGAQEHLRREMTSLYERGVRYLKSDFIGCVSDGRARGRHDPRIVGGGGLEAARIGARIIRQALPDALLLDCGGPEMPGTGHWPLLYSCQDTGNTGIIPATFHQMNFEALACHLFKNGRWGILQPSCLVTGLPGTVEDARLRATAAFLAGGQVDISDSLLSLPEDRWDILTATLPPLGVAARPIDLFEPVTGPAEYGGAASTAQGSMAVAGEKEYPPGSVWHVHVKADWDEWDLVGVFNYENEASAQSPKVSRFRIPFASLGLAADASPWAYEFWARQFLGRVPAKRVNPGGYEHPGDLQELSVGAEPGVLDVAFFGPAAKLICLRRPRPHPWVAGTSFHQSCGFELKSVRWDEAAATLSGEVHRPKGATGAIVIANAGRKVVSAEVDGLAVAASSSAGGAVVLPVIVGDSPARWRVLFGTAR